MSLGWGGKFVEAHLERAQCLSSLGKAACSLKLRRLCTPAQASTCDDGVMRLSGMMHYGDGGADGLHFDAMMP